MSTTPAVSQLFIAGVVDTGDKLITGVNDVINFNTVSFANCPLFPANPARYQTFLLSVKPLLLAFKSLLLPLKHLLLTYKSLLLSV